MKTKTINEFIGGWFVGDFEPNVYRTKEFEVGYKYFFKGEKIDAHYHTAVEINYLSHGKMFVNGVVVNAGEIFIIEPYEMVYPEYLDDCEIVVIKIPSKINDKFYEECK